MVFFEKLVSATVCPDLVEQGLRSISSNNVRNRVWVFHPSTIEVNITGRLTVVVYILFRFPSQNGKISVMNLSIATGLSGSRCNYHEWKRTGEKGASTLNMVVPELDLSSPYAKASASEKLNPSKEMMYALTCPDSTHSLGPLCASQKWRAKSKTNKKWRLTKVPWLL